MSPAWRKKYYRFARNARGRRYRVSVYQIHEKYEDWYIAAGNLSVMGPYPDSQTAIVECERVLTDAGWTL